ncbi:hypothetical protein B0I35DRAFT_436588 [Stachybotrys elegans]|uniref:DUF2461 domain-containing protein n=1 Tax=Stachybotrys elegans TaxID=80388 RepID=A0A8K0SM89_9HYPO|nr:hypothetical protein B0I35DRAFT_436588 [Stachybotrys elegans]
MPARKRSAPAESRRRSGRISNTPKKSQYFEGSDSESELPPKKRGRPSRKQAVTKEDSEEEYAEEPEEAQKEEEDDDELDEDAPPKVTIIPLETLRPLGGIDYEDQKLHKNTMLFLKDLKANNRRPWLHAHDGEYRRALKDWLSFVEAATTSIIDVDETIPELPVKDVVFRIYRDIRFSKEKLPYKPHFSAAWSRTGRKGPYACYYIHCEPGASFVGGGLWHPDKGPIDKLRRSIDERPASWRRVLNDEHLKRVFFPGVKQGSKPDAVINAFIAKNQENALKKRPQGYDIDHRDIGLLRLRNYTIGTKIDDKIFLDDDVQAKIADIIRGLSGFVNFLNRIVMPDPGQEDDDEDDEDEAD